MSTPRLRDPLALSRSTVDRMSERRRDADWLAKTWEDPRTRVFAVADGRALVTDDPPELVYTDAARAPEGVRCLLGVDDAGVAYFCVASAGLPETPGTRSASLRSAGVLLGDRDAGLFTHAVALEHWHATHRYCARCGTHTDVEAAGHVRRCPADDSQHFPRVDPAVIMLVHDGAEDPAGQRCLLGSQTVWAPDRYSTLAGFVEPGESLERAVAREVAEEVGVTVTDAHYLGSQPWPLPRSLMLGFFALAPNPGPVHFTDGEITAARWFTRAELRDAAASGEVKLPGPISIARHLIETWYGADLPGGW